MTRETVDARRTPIGVRRFGYAIAVGVAVVLVLVVNNVSEWAWLPWLTPRFEEVLSIINLSLGFNIVLGLVYMATDEPPFKAATQIIVNLLAVAVLVRVLQVYPFDFSAYDFPVTVSDFDLSWDAVARFVIGVAIFGSAMAVIGEVAKLFRSLTRS